MTSGRQDEKAVVEWLGGQKGAMLMLLEEIVKHLAVRDQERHLREVGRGVDLDRAHDEGKPREQQEPKKRALAEHRADARRGDHHPGPAVRRFAAAVSPITLIMNRHANALNLVNL